MTHTAHVTTARRGIVAGRIFAAATLADLGILPDFLVDEGAAVSPGDLIASFGGNAKQMALAEERVIGAMAKFSGIATAAWRAPALAQGRWSGTRSSSGGASPRLLDVPFLTKVAFGDGVSVEDVPRCVDAGIDLLCMGRAIVDAPLMDMRLDIIREKD